MTILIILLPFSTIVNVCTSSIVTYPSLTKDSTALAAIPDELVPPVISIESIDSKYSLPQRLPFCMSCIERLLVLFLLPLRYVLIIIKRC